MTVMKLNYDILLEALSWIDDVKTVSIFMRTCRTIYTEGVPRLFRLDVCIDARNSLHLDSFCAFMLREQSRVALLQRARFSDFVFPPGRRPLTHVTNDFVRILRGAARLKSLSVDRSVLKLHCDVSSAIASLTTIEEFSLRGDCTASRSLLRNMKSPVQKVDISFCNGSVFFHRLSFIILLSSMQDTLTDITLTFTTWPVANFTVCYPKVTHLRLIDCENTDLACLVRLFPNLRKLWSSFQLLPMDKFNDIDVAASRQWNISRQHEASWPSLDLVEMPICRLYAMAPICPIRHLSLPSFHLSDDLLQCYDTILASAQPSYLTLCTEWRDIGAYSLRDLLLRIPHGLQRLVLEVSPDPELSAAADTIVSFDLS